MVFMSSRITAVALSLVASAAIALAVTALISFLLVKVGIAGFGHMIAVMVIMPLAFAAAAWILARKFVMDQT